MYLYVFIYFLYYVFIYFLWDNSPWVSHISVHVTVLYYILTRMSVQQKILINEVSILNNKDIILEPWKG